MNNKDLPGLYIHVPFCKTKCPYCDFYSITDPSLIQSWLDGVQKEALIYSKEGFSAFDTLYIGGGTPSILGEYELEQLIGSLRKGFAFSPDAEVTIEMNPGDITASRLAQYKALGINRLSVGVQSLQEGELRFLRRRHTAAAAERAMEIIQSSGLHNYGVDLMYGFHGQTKRSWLDTLERVLSWGPVHLSCYQLTVSDGTPFGRMVSEGKLKRITGEQERRFFTYTSHFLQDHGFIHYEVSNFAKGEEYFSCHNLKYWQRAPYLGLGPGAHSFRDNVRWWNHRSVRDYCHLLLLEGKRPVAGQEKLSPEQVRLERLLLGFRTQNGVDVDDIVYQSSDSEMLARLTSSGIIRVEESRALPTLNGYLIADRLPLMFFN
jgi:putative oxygen-independent coproporphyrinogen III oxidase